MRLRSGMQRGDTLVEVLLATAVLAMIVTGTSVIMTAGLATAQLSLERTQVQASVAGQASVLRALREAAVKERSPETGALWELVGSYANAPSATLQQAVCTPVPSTAIQRFYFDNTAGSVSSWLQPQLFAEMATDPSDLKPKNDFVPTPGDGIWIEAYAYGNAATDPMAYYDFYIKACWDAAGGDQQEVKTVVRLYANS